MKKIFLWCYLFLSSYVSTAQIPISEEAIGSTFYDLQTHRSISNRLIYNSDGTISAGWITSPDALQASVPTFPNRGTGYNYFDGNAWQNLYPNEFSAIPLRIGSSNLVIASDEAEMDISHQRIGTTQFSRIAISWRQAKGTVTWATTFPFGNTFQHLWPKACAGGDNYIYAIWLGSGTEDSAWLPDAVVEGQTSPLYFSRSPDGGRTWEAKRILAEIDSTHYVGFSADSYSIDAKDSIVAISFGETTTDVGLLKSEDHGLTWTKTIIQTASIPFYQTDQLTDTNSDGIADTLNSNSGDSKVLIDNDGMCHVWFSDQRWIDNDSADNMYDYFPLGSDALFYWNENMLTDGYVKIAAAQDLNGNGLIDLPLNSLCSPIGNYGGGLTQMPSAGISAGGTIYLSYQAVCEEAIGTDQARRHVYMMTLAKDANGNYDPGNWTYPYDIVNSFAQGGSGEQQEAVFACVARNVGPDYAYVLYQRDEWPGHAISPDSTCDSQNNLGAASDMMIAYVDLAIVEVKNINQENIFVTQNFPNPCHSETFINVLLNKSTDIRISVTDFLGRNVYSDAIESTGKEKNQIKLNVEDFNSGIYYYTVTTGDNSITKRLVVN